MLFRSSQFTIFGLDLADGVAGASSLPLPTTLNTTSVEIGGVPVPLQYVSPTQINGITAPNLGASANVELVVKKGSVRSASTFYRLVSATPGLFTLDRTAGGPVNALHSADFTQINSLRPARRGEIVVLFATGLGAVNVGLTPGAGAPENPIAMTVGTPVVMIGNVQVPVTFSGLSPRSVGLFQVNVQIGDNVPTGLSLPIVVTMGGQVSNTATIAVTTP